MRAGAPLAALALAAALVLGGCVQTRSARLASPAESARIRTAVAVRAWRVVEDGELRGVVVQFGPPDAPTESFYSVRNRWHQELGVVDSLGRTWRYRPHEREAEHAATGTLLDGAIALLEAGARCSLEEMELSELRDLHPSEPRFPHSDRR